MNLADWKVTVQVAVDVPELDLAMGRIEYMVRKAKTTRYWRRRLRRIPKWVTNAIAADIRRTVFKRLTET